MFRKIPVQFSSLENKTLISLQKKKKTEKTRTGGGKKREIERGWKKQGG